MQHTHWILIIACMPACALNDDDVEIDSAALTVHGPGPISGHEWFTGHWVNRDDDRNRDFEAWRDMPADSVTQSIKGMDHWYQHAGCVDERCVDRELRQSRAAFAPTFDGVFDNMSWRSHIWGPYPATEHRRRLIHLGWMDTIPHDVGNGDGANPTLWRDIKQGSADKYMFLLGRKFAFLDAQHGDPRFPMTFDITYEWTLKSHPSFPGGSYVVDDVRHETFRDFPYGWSRMVRVFREGYKFQRGRDCPYNFSWRPQLVLSVRDNNGPVTHDRMWPNRVRDWTIPNPVVIGGMTVLPAGPIGAQANLLCLSWHDSARERVHGTSANAPGNNWRAALEGTESHWGLQTAADFTRDRGVKLCMPEWSPRRGLASEGGTSTHPGDVIRFTHAFLRANKANLSYENVFDQGDGALETPWQPAQPPAQDPGRVYRSLWQ